MSIAIKQNRTKRKAHLRVSVKGNITLNIPAKTSQTRKERLVSQLPLIAKEMINLGMNYGTLSGNVKANTVVLMSRHKVFKKKFIFPDVRQNV